MTKKEFEKFLEDVGNEEVEDEYTTLESEAIVIYIYTVSAIAQPVISRDRSFSGKRDEGINLIKAARIRYFQVSACPGCKDSTQCPEHGKLKEYSDWMTKKVSQWMVK